MNLPTGNTRPEFPSNMLEKATTTRLVAVDVDGVLTDGGIYIAEQGELLKRFNSQDGLGIRLLQRFDIDVCIITGRSSNIVLQRAAEIGITTIIQSCKDKREALEKLAAERELDVANIAFAGDDLPDIPAMSYAGFSVAVANAHCAVKAAADWTTTYSGGNGAIRELCDLILVAQDKYDSIIGEYTG